MQFLAAQNFLSVDLFISVKKTIRSQISEMIRKPGKGDQLLASW